jgi:hypothetical protein
MQRTHVMGKSVIVRAIEKTEKLISGAAKSNVEKMSSETTPTQNTYIHNVSFPIIFCYCWWSG